jgi:hypothetical protein
MKLLAWLEQFGRYVYRLVRWGRLRREAYGCTGYPRKRDGTPDKLYRRFETFAYIDALRARRYDREWKPRR